MKPRKKENNLNAKKKLNVKKNKDNGSDTPVPVMQSFFKAAPKSFVVEKTNVSVKPNNDDRQFYVDLLKSKLESKLFFSFLLLPSNLFQNLSALPSFDLRFFVAYTHKGYTDVDILANVNEAHEAVGLEHSDSHRNVETKAPSESETDNSKHFECTGCIRKAAERDEWERKYKQESEQRKELKKVYMNLNVEFSELYMKHKSLLKAKGNDRDIIHGEVSDGAAMVSEATGGAATVSEATGGAATGSDVTFTEAQLKFLQFMPLDKKNDCTFILQCLKYAYKSDPNILASKTLKGTAKRTEITADGIEIHHEMKAPLTPEKVDRIKSLFMDRISKCEIHSAEYVERMKDTYVNKLFAAGIGNLSKKPK